MSLIHYVEKEGATYVFGPQKKVKDLEKTDQAMKHYAKIMSELVDKDDSYLPGAGAAEVWAMR